MASTSNKAPFHTYENAGYEDNNCVKNVDSSSNGHNDAVATTAIDLHCHQNENGSQYQNPAFASSSISASSTSSTTFSNLGSISGIPNIAAVAVTSTTNNSACEVNMKAATTATIESPFTDPMLKSSKLIRQVRN